MLDALCGVEADLQDLVLGPGLRPEGHRHLVDLLHDELVVVGGDSALGFDGLLDHEDVEVVDAGDVLARSHRRHVQGVQEPARKG